MGLSDFFDSLSGYLKYNALKEDKPQIAFYSEMGTDRIYFEGVINQLLTEHQQSILYLTSSKTDPLYQSPPRGLTPIYIGDGMMRTTLFMQIDVPLFVMTLPDLETFHLKRSQAKTRYDKNVHYAYIFHSLVSTTMIYRHQAFDAYDSILCVGPHHLTEIREAENIFNLPAKNLIKHGYPRIDHIKSQYQEYLKRTENVEPLKKTKIIVAPSWGENSITDLCLDNVISTLVNSNYAVTFRPHPMSLRHDPDLKSRCLKQYGKTPDFYFDDNIAQTDTLFDADIMICDWSGVALEFSLSTEKPVIFIDTPAKQNNTAFHQFSSIPVEVSLREELGSICKLEDINLLPEKVSHFLDNPTMQKERIEALRNTIIFNQGTSDEVGAIALMDLLISQQS